jgi:hypothetical protein
VHVDCLVCLVWSAVSTIRDCVVVATRRWLRSAAGCVPCRIGDFLVAHIIKARWCSRRDDAETRTVAQGTQIVHLRTAREFKILKRENELKAADADIGDVALKEVEFPQGATALQEAHVRYFPAIPEVEYLKCGNELKTADAGIRHAGGREVELLQSATAA